jgi:hypothetical protein
MAPTGILADQKCLYMPQQPWDLLLSLLKVVIKLFAEFGKYIHNLEN